MEVKYFRLEKTTQSSKSAGAKYVEFSQSPLVRMMMAVFALAGCFHLYFGINDVGRVIVGRESPGDFGWLVPVCLAIFVVFFLVSVYAQMSFYNKRFTRGVILNLSVFLFLFLVIMPASTADFVNSPFVREVFDTNSRWLRQAILAYSQFTLSAVLLSFLFSLIMNGLFMRTRTA